MGTYTFVFLHWRWAWLPRTSSPFYFVLVLGSIVMNELTNRFGVACGHTNASSSLSFSLLLSRNRVTCGDRVGNLFVVACRHTYACRSSCFSLLLLPRTRVALMSELAIRFVAAYRHTYACRSSWFSLRSFLYFYYLVLVSLVVTE